MFRDLFSIKKRKEEEMNGFVKMTGISAVLAAAGVLCGAESIAPQTLSDWAGVNQNVTQDAEGVITMKPKSTTISAKKAITVDPAKTYKLFGKFRKVPGSTVDTRIYFGLASCDEKGNPIPSGAVIVMPNTDTVLADAVKKGDKVIKVKDASKWDKRNFKIVAFNTKADLSDLPNRTFSSNITKLEQKGDVWEITLQAPMRTAYPAGTAVRQQSHGSTYMYPGAAYVSAPADWKEFTAEIKGQVKSGSPSKQWWPGARKGKIVIFSVWNKPTEMQFKDISLTEK